MLPVFTTSCRCLAGNEKVETEVGNTQDGKPNHVYFSRALIGSSLKGKGAES